MSQYIPPHDVKAGQVRTWKFEGELTPAFNGTSFLVADVDGVRAEVTCEDNSQSYYVVWLANHSEVLIETEKNCK